MTIETFLLWLVVGLIAGWLASVVVSGGSGGLVHDIVTGVVGAFLGGMLFTGFRIRTFRGFAGTVFVAFVGAVVLLLALRLIRRVRAGRPPPAA